MWINPIGRSYADESTAESIRAIKSKKTQVEVVSLSTSPSPNDLEYRSYATLSHGDMLRVVRYAAGENYDAVVIGCFYDPIGNRITIS